MQQEDDTLFIDDDDSKPLPDNASSKTPPWKIAIVDDDEDVHRSTRFATANHHPVARSLSLLQSRNPPAVPTLSNVAVILLDVVMETEHAGLELVSFIRDELRWTDTRIILRTGQPGYAPEEDAIRDFDINDYKTKSELTRKKLLTSLTATMRSYDQIRTIDASRRGLHQIIESSASFTFDHGIQAFAAGVITRFPHCAVYRRKACCAHRAKALTAHRISNSM
jgi:CheY-like chemotaxis protein